MFRENFPSSEEYKYIENLFYWSRSSQENSMIITSQHEIIFFVALR